MEIQSAIAVVLAYLIGSVDFGVILPRLAGVDIYAEGSGNPGASNVMRTMGKKWAAAVLLGDIGKGFVAVLLADVWVGEPAGYAALLAAVAGHCYPVWHRFHGGKGVAAAVGGLLWLEPLVGLVAGVLWLGVVATLGVASVASLAIVAVAIAGVLVAGVEGWALGWFLAAMVLVLYRHRGNIERLLRRQEHRVEAT